MIPPARELRPALVTPAFRKKLCDALEGSRAPRPITALRENPHRWWGVFLAAGSVLLTALLIGGSAPLGLLGYAMLVLALVGIGCGALGWWQRRTLAPPGRFVYVCDFIDTRSGRSYVTDLTTLMQARVLEEHLGRGLSARLHLQTAEGELSLPFGDRRAADRALQSLRAARQQYRAAAEQQDAAALAALDPFYELRASGEWDAVCAPLASKPQEPRFVLGMPLAPAAICGITALLLAVPAWFGIGRMRDEAAFSYAKAVNTVKAWDAYLNRPDPRHRYDVQLRLKPAAALLAAEREGNPAALRKFLHTYGDTLAAAEARALLHDKYERARSRVSAEHKGEAAEALRGLLDWLEEHGGAQVEVCFQNDSLGLASFDALLDDTLRKSGAPANLIDPIAPVFTPTHLRANENQLLGALADGLASYATTDVLQLQRGERGSTDEAGLRPRLAVNWSAAPQLAPGTRPIVDQRRGSVYWPLLFHFELDLLVPGRAPFAERFDFEPAKFIPAVPTEHYSLYLRMIELAFDEATQRAGQTFFPQRVPGRRYAREESGMPGSKVAVAQKGTRELLRGSATGFAISPLGYIATARHFTSEARKYRVELPGGPAEAALVRDDPENDLAILELNEPLPGVLAIRASSSVRLGESVATLGYPQILVQGVEPKFGRGEISSLSGLRDDPRHFQISVPVQPGNSGGPLVDLSGQVIGVIVARLNGGQIVNYAVKSNQLLKLMEAIPELRPAAIGAAAGESRKLEDVVDDLRRAVVLIKGYVVE
jgi:S1-C subfamily serine protease